MSFLFRSYRLLSKPKVGSIEEEGPQPQVEETAVVPFNHDGEETGRELSVALAIEENDGGAGDGRDLGFGGWVQFWDKNYDKYYFFQETTGTTTWIRPSQDEDKRSHAMKLFGSVDDDDMSSLQSLHEEALTEDGSSIGGEMVEAEEPAFVPLVKKDLKTKAIMSVMDSDPAASHKGMLLLESVEGNFDPDGEVADDPDRLAAEEAIRFASELEKIREHFSERELFRLREEFNKCVAPHRRRVLVLCVCDSHLLSHRVRGPALLASTRTDRDI